MWIAEEFRDEHRATLDYLNQRTEETWEFFGVVVELWKIDESRAAPYFKLVATPNDWRKKAASVNSKANSELGECYRDFYRGLIEKLVETRFSGSREAPPRNIMDFGSGYSAFKYRAYISKQRARIAAYIDSSDYEWNKSLFDQIEEDKLEIESEIGASLEWDRSDNNRYSLISTVNARGIEEEQEILSEIQDWMVDRLLKFKEVFGPRLAELVD